MKDTEGIIESELHGQLPFQFKENFSDVEFTPEDLKEEVEFTVVTVRQLISRLSPCRGGASHTFLLALISVSLFSSKQGNKL